jgi:tryptophanyl-tRNA synthetase
MDKDSEKASQPAQTDDTAAEEGKKQLDGEPPKIKEQIVTAFEVEAGEGGVDYDKLIDQFGCDKITEEHLQKIEELSGLKPHRFLRRGIFFSHRSLNFVLNAFESGRGFYLYTGRGPSSTSLHLGHTIPFIFTKYLQDAFDVPLVIQITDDEKFFHKSELTLEKAYTLGMENIKDIIAFGFDPDKTFIFSDIDYIKTLYPNVCKMQRALTLNNIKGVFGFNDSDNAGKYAFPAIQAVPSFSNTFPHIFGKKKNVPCLIPQAIDQDPYFRMTRDIAKKLKYEKPACIHAKFFPAITGLKGKMSASVASTTIYLSDDPKQIKNKIKKYAFSGGGETLDEHKANGANLDVDIAYQYLRFFMEDDYELQRIGEEYKAGRMMTGEIKEICSEVITKFVSEYQEKRKKITDEDVKHFCSTREINPMSSKLPPKPEKDEKGKGKKEDKKE